MPAKGYWIGRISTHDPDTYAKYVAGNCAAYAKFGGRMLVRGGKFDVSEGEARDRNVVIEFPSYQAALDCYHSPEYQSVIGFRQAASEGELIVVEGYDGPQPGE